MRIEIKNGTVFRTEDVRALLRGALAAVGYAAAPGIPLRVEIATARKHVSIQGRANLGRRKRHLHGRWMKLWIPPVEAWTADTWRELVAVTVHEAMHLVGSEHKDMTEAQRQCTLPLPEWAKPLQPWRVEEAKPEGERWAAARADRLEHARSMLKKAETRAKRADTIRGKWERRVKALERNLRKDLGL